MPSQDRSQKGRYAALFCILNNLFFCQVVLFCSITFLLISYDNLYQGDELEEGEIAVSGESHMHHQQSGSWIHDRDEGEEDQVLQKPKIKRKRSLRVRPRHTMERLEDKSGSEMASLNRGESSILSGNKYPLQTRMDPESKLFGDSSSSKHDKNESILKNKRNLPSRKVANASKSHVPPKFGRLNTDAPSEDNGEHSRESWKGKLNNSGSSSHRPKMTEIIKRGVCVIK
jgi:SWI/SNF-related matrix-associated actin-dependent regulator of chromatin subfamily A protein 2/4